MTENLIRGGPTRRDAIAETLEVSVERSLRVMIVDDEAVAADALVQLVRFWGHDGQAAYDGASGLELAARHVPEVVFLDLAMPDMNGSELAKELRSTTGSSGVL